MDPGLNANLSNRASVSTKHATLLAFQGVQGRRRTPATQRAALLPRLLGTPWCLFVTLGPGDLQIDHQPCRKKRRWVSNDRGRTPTSTLSAHGENRSTFLRHCNIRETGTKIDTGDRSDHRPVTDCLASDAQLQRKSFVVTEVRCAAHPGKWGQPFGPGVGLPP